jgi:quinol monooxygenase YgiN
VPRYGLHGPIRAHPGRGDALIEHMLEAARLMRDAPGCDLYLVSRDAEDPDIVWITEAWASEADHDASLTMPGVPGLIGRARPIIAELGPSRRLVPLDGAGLRDHD